MLKVITFDWDGTLADSVPTIMRCKRFLAEKYNTPAPSAQQVSDVLGLNFEVAMQRSFPGLNKEQLKKIGDEYHALMHTPEYYSKLFPGVKSTLQKLKNANLKLAIATSKVRGEFDNEIAASGVADLFDLTLCGGEQGDKPHPQKLHYIMNYFKVSCEQTVMVGDTKVDMQFARRAGVKAVAVTFGAHNKQTLQQEHPAWVIDDWSDFFDMVISISSDSR